MKKLLLILLMAVGVMGAYKYEQSKIQHPIDTGFFVVTIAYDDAASAIRPLMLLHPGHGGCVDSSWTHRLVDYGYVVANVNQRGFCFPSYAVSTATGAMESSDHYYGCKFILQKYNQYIDTTKIVWVGYSKGAGTGMLLSTRFPDFINKYVLFFGCPDYLHYWNWYSQSMRDNIIPYIGDPDVNPKPFYARQGFRSISNINDSSYFYIIHDVDDATNPVDGSRRWRDSLVNHFGDYRVNYVETNISSTYRATHTGSAATGTNIVNFEKNTAPFWADSVLLKPWPGKKVDSIGNNLNVIGVYNSKHFMILPSPIVNRTIGDSTGAGWSDVLGLSYDMRQTSRTITVNNNVTARRITQIRYQLNNADIKQSTVLTRTNLVTGASFKRIVNKWWVDSLGVNEKVKLTFTDYKGDNKKILTGARRWCTIALPDSSLFKGTQQNILLCLDMRRVPIDLWLDGATRDKWVVVDSITGNRVNTYIDNFNSTDKTGLMWLHLVNAAPLKKYHIEVGDFNASDSISTFYKCNVRYSCDEISGNLNDPVGGITFTVNGTPTYGYTLLENADTTIFTRSINNYSATASYFRSAGITALAQPTVTKFVYTCVYKFPDSIPTGNHRIMSTNYNGTNFTFALMVIGKRLSVTTNLTGTMTTTAVVDSLHKMNNFFSTQFNKIDVQYDGSLTGSNRVKIYINGIRRTATGSAPAAMAVISGTPYCYTGMVSGASMSGCLAESQLMIDTTFGDDYLLTQSNCYMDNNNFWLIAPTANTIPVDTTKIGSFDWVNSSGTMYPSSGWSIRIVRGTADTVNTTITSQNEYGFTGVTPASPLPARSSAYEVLFVNGTTIISRKMKLSKSGNNVVYNFTGITVGL